MGMRITELQYKATSTVKYRYNCVKCENATKWFKFNLETIVSHRMTSSRFEVKALHDINGLEKTGQKALKQLRKLISLMKKMQIWSGGNTPPDRAIIQQFDDLFAKGKKCPQCKAKQPWYPAASFLEEKTKNPDFIGPEIKWGKVNVELLGMPAPEEYIVEDADDEGTPTFVDRIISSCNAKIMYLKYEHICKIEHENILYIQSVHIVREDAIAIQEEVFEGVTFAEMLKKGISESDFTDYILQLCDALEYLHSNGLTHNAIYPQNILIGKDNLLKLTHFEEIAESDCFRNDIAMLGALINSIDEKFIKRYKKFIEKCENEENQTIRDVKADVINPSKTPYAVLITALIFVGTIIVVISRRIL